MKVLVIKGGPRVKGTTNTIVEEFIKGAKSAAHEVKVFDNGRGAIKPCLGCKACWMNGTCIQKDPMNDLIQDILSTDYLVLVSPMYYFGLSAQLKAVIDRFYSHTSKITNRHLKVIYIVAAMSDDDRDWAAIEKHLDTLTDYMQFNEVDRIMAKGAGEVYMIDKKYLEKAYKIGAELK